MRGRPPPGRLKNPHHKPQTAGRRREDRLDSWRVKSSAYGQLLVERIVSSAGAAGSGQSPRVFVCPASRPGVPFREPILQRPTYEGVSRDQTGRCETIRKRSLLWRVRKKPGTQGRKLGKWDWEAPLPLRTGLSERPDTEARKHPRLSQAVVRKLPRRACDALREEPTEGRERVIVGSP